MHWEQITIVDKKRNEYQGEAAKEFARKILKDDFSKKLPTTDDAFYVRLTTGEPIIDLTGVRNALEILLDNGVRVIVDPAKVLQIHTIPFQEKSKKPLPVEKAGLNRIAQKTKSLLWFGTDLNKKDNDEPLSQQEAKNILADALKTGFTYFDAAYKYQLQDHTCTIDLLDKAATDAGIKRDLITVLYKVTHGVDLNTQCDHFKPTLWGKRILALHDIEGEDLEDRVKRVCALAKENKMAFGVSNLNMAYFDMIQQWAEQAGSTIEYVENRYTPYTLTQAEVIEHCREKKIVYLVYGIGGSSFKGSCDSVAGNPADLLTARLDKQLLKTVKNPDELMYTLCQWAARQEIFPIVKTSKKKRMEEYLKECQVPKKFDEAMAEYVVARKYEDAKDPWANSFYSLPPNLLNVISSLPCPLMWRIIEMLVKAGLKEYLVRLATSISENHKKPAELLANNVLRLAFEYQLLHSNEGPEKWEQEVIHSFKEWEKASVKTEPYECAIEWACKNASEKGMGGGVNQVRDQIISGKYVPAFPFTDTGGKNAGLTKTVTVTMGLSLGPLTAEEDTQLDAVYAKCDSGKVPSIDFAKGATQVTFMYYFDPNINLEEDLVGKIKEVRGDAKTIKRDEKWTKKS